MRVFLSEHCTCGADPAAAAGPLAAEGAAMLRALAADAAEVEGVEVVVAWAAGLDEFGVGGVEVVEVRQKSNGRRIADPGVFDRLFWEVDASLHIAPEGAISISDRWGDYSTEQLGDHGREVLGASDWACRVCGDKLHLHDVAENTGLRRPAAVEGVVPLPIPFVRKQQYGAGGECVVFRHDDDLAASPVPVWEELGLWDEPEPHWTWEYFSESYVPGRPHSVAVIDSAPLPPGEQDVRITGKPGVLSYHGGAVPAARVDAAAVNRLVEQVRAAVPGLRGWWGIDFVIPDEPFPPGDPAASRDPVLIEVNPRLTTSYLGYRRLTDDNLAERLLFPDRAFSPLRWKDATVRFTKDGTVDVTP